MNKEQRAIIDGIWKRSAKTTDITELRNGIQFLVGFIHGLDIMNDHEIPVFGRPLGTPPEDPE